MSGGRRDRRKPTPDGDTKRMIIRTVVQMAAQLIVDVVKVWIGRAGRL
jgi:hypothetical protein